MTLSECKGMGTTLKLKILDVHCLLNRMGNLMSDNTSEYLICLSVYAVFTAPVSFYKFHFTFTV